MKSRLLSPMIVAAALAVFGSHAGLPSAQACAGSMSIDTDKLAPAIAAADAALNNGQHSAAAKSVLEALPLIRYAHLSKGPQPIQDKAVRIIALAVVRSGGAIALSNDARDVTAKERAANLEWAIVALRNLNMARPNTPFLQTDLGEALSKVDNHKEEARKILEELAERDLITSPQGYAALSMMKGAAGDAPGRDAARKRCEEMAKEKAVCGQREVPSS